MTFNPKVTINRRHQRSMMIMGQIMEMANEFIPGTYNKTIFAKKLFDFINDEGMEIITDKMRQSAGLEPRNVNGCTSLELMLIEYYFMSRMMKPIIVQFPPPITGELIKDDDK